MEEDFPDVPDLEFGVMPASQPTRVQPPPEAAPRPAPEEPKTNAAGPSEEQPGAAEAPSVLDESVDEILNQTSEQMLQLAKLEDRLKDVVTNLDELTEQVVTGFVEMKQAGASGSTGAAIQGDENAGRFAELELQVDKVARQHTQLLILALVQVLLVGLLGIWLLASSAATPPPPPAVPTASSVSPPPTPASPVDAAASSDSDKTPAPKAKTRKKKRRR